MPPEPLPIDPYLPAIRDALIPRRAVVVTAAPGAGKTTRVPPVLAPDGPVIVLQPRRLAARAIARRIASEQGWTIGDEVGWQVRFERRFSARTRVLLATEGILTARLQQDPLLSAFRTIVLDEFHERSIHADLGLALARQAWLARDDLRVVVMSATLETSAVSTFLDGCPVIDVPGRLHPVSVSYCPGESLTDVAVMALGSTRGTVLGFLPGAAEIARAVADVRARLGAGADVVPLHGSLTPDEQDRALEEPRERRVVLATNIAETSLTVPRVTAVIDTGLEKVARYDPARAIDSLDVERIAADSAAQRAGRAGRVAAGRVYRLWSETDRLRPHHDPEIHRVDLSAAALAVLSWGGDPRAFEWFEPPSVDAVDAALALLARLGAVVDGAITPLGRELQKLPVHPRLARMLIDAGGSADVARACALLSERHLAPRHPPATSSDLLSAIEDERTLPRHVRDVADQLARLASRAPAPARAHPSYAGERAFRHALFAGYADRVARRRAAGSPRFLLASGHGAILGPESGVHDAEFVVAIDVQAGRRGEGSEARIRVASAVDEAWLKPTGRAIDHVFDAATGVVRATERIYYDALALAERPARVDPAEASRLLAQEYVRRGPQPEDAQLLRRLRFAGLPHEFEALAIAASAGRSSIADVDLARALPDATLRQLDRLAPETLRLPRGRTVRLEYRDDGAVVASIKLQEVFGLAESPRLGPRQEPVTFSLLAPNGRPVQTTKDLRSFWERTYAEVRKELRGRYPKHEWPEEPRRKRESRS